MVGFARREMSDDAFRDHLRKGVDRYSRNRPIKESIWESFAQGIQYHHGSFDDPEAWAGAVERCWTASIAIGGPPAIGSSTWPCRRRSTR